MSAIPHEKDTPAQRAAAVPGALTVAQAAQRANMAPNALRYHITTGNLAAIRVHDRLFLIDPAELDAFLVRPKRKPGNPDMKAMANSRWGKAANEPAKPRGKAIPAPAKVTPEMIIPPGVKFTRVPAPPPRFQVVELPTMRGSTTTRSGSDDFRKHQRAGRF